jgi:hypothetical protein
MLPTHKGGFGGAGLYIGTEGLRARKRWQQLLQLHAEKHPDVFPTAKHASDQLIIHQITDVQGLVVRVKHLVRGIDAQGSSPAFTVLVCRSFWLVPFDC